MVLYDAVKEKTSESGSIRIGRSRNEMSHLGEAVDDGQRRRHKTVRPGAGLSSP